MKPVFFPRGSFPPVSNTERQRQFRQRNPDYYRLLQAKRRAHVRALCVAAEVRARAVAEIHAKMLAKSAQLLLPAPVQVPVIPGLNAIPATLAELAELRERAAAGGAP